MNRSKANRRMTFPFIHLTMTVALVTKIRRNKKKRRSGFTICKISSPFFFFYSIGVCVCVRFVFYKMFTSSISAKFENHFQIEWEMFQRVFNSETWLKMQKQKQKQNVFSIIHKTERKKKLSRLAPISGWPLALCALYARFNWKCSCWYVYKAHIFIAM